MTNFAFLYPEFRELLKNSQEAEKHVLSVPRTSLFYARLSMEQAVNWMYDHNANLERPYDIKIAALTYEPSFKRIVPPYILNKLTYIRKADNIAVHGKAVRPANAELHQQ